MTDDKTRQLENRIETLEFTIEKMMPSRRDALKMGGAALVGGAAMSGTASAGTNQVGTIGSQASPVDIESEDINNADTVTTQDLVVNGTATGAFGGGIVFKEGDPVNETRGDLVSVAANSFFTIFNVTSPVDVYGGAVYGTMPSRLRITFGTGTTITFGNDNDLDRGKTRPGDEFGVQPIFPMESVSKLEVYNDLDQTRDYGFQVYTT